MPLKILANFEPEEEFVLNPGDMLYLPPRYAHDGVAVGECMTFSIGFRAPNRAELAGELLQRLAEDAADAVGEGLYRDPKQVAVEHSGAIPAAMVEFAQAALADALQDPLALRRALGVAKSGSAAGCATLGKTSTFSMEGIGGEATRGKRRKRIRI